MGSSLTSRSRLWECVRSLSVLLIVAATATAGCAAQTIDRPGSAPTMSPPVFALYNEGAAAFRAGDFRRAQEKYQAALDEARSLGDERGTGFSLAGLGAAHQALREYPRALEFISAAVPYFERTENLAAEGLALGAIGEVHLQMASNAEAIAFFDRSLAIGEKVLANASEQERISILAVRANVLGQKAVAHQNLEQFDEAVENYRRAAADYRVVENPNMAGTALWLAGTISRLKVKAPHLALELLSEASALLEETGKVAEVVSVRLELGLAYEDAGKFHDAADAFTEAIKMADRKGLYGLVVDGYLRLGQALESLGQFEGALASYEAAFQRLRNDNGEPLHQAEFLYLKGSIYRVLSQYEEAVEHFHAAAVKYREAQQLKGEADALTRLAEIFFWLADYKTATQHYKRILGLHEAADDMLKQVEILAALAETSWLGGEASADEISGYFDQGRNLLDLIKTTVGFDPAGPMLEVKKKLHNNFDRESMQLARKWREKVHSLSQEELFAVTYVDFIVGESKHSFNEWQKKVPSLGSNYLMAAGTFWQKAGTASVWRGDPVIASGNLHLAEAYHTSIPFNRDVGIEWAKDWFYLGEAYRRQGKFDVARLFLNRAKVMALLLRSSEIHWVDAGLARTYADMGDAVKALAHYRLGLKMLESVQSQQGTEETKIGVMEGALYIYRDLVPLLLDLHTKTGKPAYLHEAFEYNERLRARAFLEMLGKSGVTRLGGDLGSLAEKEGQIRHQIARIHRQLRAPKLDKAEETRLLDELEGLRRSWRSQQEQVARGSEQYADLVLPRPVTVKDVQSVLAPDEVLLEYSVASDTLILWALTNNEIEAYRIPGAEEKSILEQYLVTLREPLIGSDEISRHLDLGRRLYRELLEPGGEHIRGKKKLIIAPDGPLYYLPFEAVIFLGSTDPSNNPTSLSDVPYLVKEFQVSYVPSASVFVAQRRNRGTKGATVEFPILAFGDPIYQEVGPQLGVGNEPGKVAHRALRDASLSRLEFSAEEVERIARIWDIPIDSEHINLQNRATVGRLRELDLSRYRILHFATHGLMGDEIGWTSQPALVLSQVGNIKEHGGLLQFGDILNLKLNADLVVLSACNTGLGRLRDGEGIVGLTRAFMYAGASSVVVSLWKVEDQSTSLFMERFYQRLKQGESKAEALRQAKLEVMQATIELKAIGMPQKLASPFYWAPFILVGDPR